MWRKEISFWEKWQEKWQQIRQPRKAIYVVSRECVGCKQCAKICRHRVLSMVSVGDKVYATACRQERCSQCGKCIVCCPKKAIMLVRVINNN
jgi:formate hydrogenlyase subunit 6/NADH:ubiquinone oxidoreductase subunit I